LLRSLLAIFLLSSLASVGFSTPILKEIKAYEDDDGVVTVFEFDSAVDEKQLSLDFIKNTIQLNIPQVKVVPSRQSTKISGSNVRNIYTYQVNDGLARSRIIYKKSTRVDSFKENALLTVNGSTVTLRIANQAVAKAVEPDLNSKPPVAMGDNEPLADESSLSLLSEEMDQKSKSEPGLVNRAEEKLSEELPLGNASGTSATIAPSSVEPVQAEAEIPVLVAPEKKAAVTHTTPWARMLIGFGITGMMIIGFGLIMKKYWKQNGIPNKHTNIRILTQHHLGPKKSLAIIRVAGESMLIGITDQNINLIKSLSLLDEEIPQDAPEHFAPALRDSERLVSDRISLSTTGGGLKSLLGSQTVDMKPDQIEGFTMKGLKEVVTQRLKGMKEI
jgi:flagellar protein FliO/FliZ